MKQSVKDQLVKVLDTEGMRNTYHYTVEALRRTPNVDPEHLLAWEVRLSPEYGYIARIGEIAYKAKQVDVLTCVFAYFDDDNYILLL